MALILIAMAILTFQVKVIQQGTILDSSKQTNLN